jgi:hypothetical protein
LPDLLAKATKEPLTNDEANVLAAALRINEPWLEWAGKREQKSFTVDPLALHIHERVSTQAILKSPPAKTSTAVSSPIPSRNTTRPSSSTGTMSANAPKATRGPAT